MNQAIERLSASGARIRGDDYQHLGTWWRVLLAIRDPTTVAVGIEDPRVAGADDVTIYRTSYSPECWQIKYSVSGSSLFDLDWLTSPSRSGGDSILQRLYRVAREDPQAQIKLLTNRLANPEDDLVAALDGDNRKTARLLLNGGPRSKNGLLRKRLATHLRSDEKSLEVFLNRLSFIIGRSKSDLLDDAFLVMSVLGLQTDAGAIETGLTLVRAWVTSGKRLIEIDEVRQAIDALELAASPPPLILRVHAIDHVESELEPDAELDWVDLFVGNEPRTRRLLADPGLWNEQLRREATECAQALRAKGTHLLVEGAMRLPTWFMVGTALGRTTGIEVIRSRRGMEWRSDAAPESYPVTAVSSSLGRGSEVAVIISVSTDITHDVRAYIQQCPQIGHCIWIQPQTGVSDRALTSTSEALGCAYELRDEVRKHASSFTRLHLFMALPDGLALLLGHLWDRVPPTQLYEDMGAGKGYSASYFIPS